MLTDELDSKLQIEDAPCPLVILCKSYPLQTANYLLNIHDNGNSDNDNKTQLMVNR